ncbi:MAG: hypothetical protein FWE80_06550 [Oscillospiraceae bacterium]|nr:hypothetical protein [Oscillospiraceae bacterium]
MNNLSLKAKILVSVLAVVVVGAVAAVAVVLLTGDSQPNPPAGDDPVSGVTTTTAGESPVPTSDDPTTAGGDAPFNPDITNPPAADNPTVAPSGGSPPAPTSPIGSLHPLWDRLSGYWISGEGPFVGFFGGSAVLYFEYGLQQSEYWVRGVVTGSEATNEHTWVLTVFVEAVPATEMYDARPESTETIYLDVSTLEHSGIIRIKNGDGGWDGYSYKGSTLE